MKEQFIPLMGYEGLYEISDLGNIKSLPKKYGKYISKEKIMKPQLHPDGHYIISLKKGGKSKSFRRGRLVGLHFVPNPYNKPLINHKNGVKTQDDKDNLEWSTVSEDALHRHRVLKVRNNSVRVRVFLNGNRIKTYKNIKTAAKKLGCSVRSINRGLYEGKIVNKKYKVERYTKH